MYKNVPNVRVLKFSKDLVKHFLRFNILGISLLWIQYSNELALIYVLYVLQCAGLSFSLGASVGYTVAVSKPMGLRRSRFRATEFYGQSP
jgi:hypothetical protein